MGSALSSIKVTLYDVFGYLLPGLVLLAGVAMVFRAVYLPGQPLAIDELSIQTWSLLLVAAYFLGHIAQGLGNGIEAIVEKRFQSFEGSILGKQVNGEQEERSREQEVEQEAESPSRSARAIAWLLRSGHQGLVWLLGEQEPMPPALRNRAREKATKILGLTSDQVDEEWLYRICDEALAQRGQVQNREVYIYREGFYRSLAIAFSFLSISFLVSAWQTTTFGDVSVASSGVEFGWPDFLVFAGVSAVGAWLACRRYARFGCYRVRQAVTGFLMLKEEVQPEVENGMARAKDNPVSSSLNRGIISSKVVPFVETIVVIPSKPDRGL